MAFYAALPEAWRAEPSRNMVAGALAAVVTLPISMGLGARLTRRVPPLFIGLLGGTLIHYLLVAAGFSGELGATLGKIPWQLPDGRQIAGIVKVMYLPGFAGAFPGMILAAASIAVVASLDVLISAKVVENLSGQRGNSSRELICVGTANALTPLFGGIIGSISLASTTANYASGARNSLSLFTHAVLFLLIVPLLGANGRRILAIELEGPMFFASAELLHNRIDATVTADETLVCFTLDRARFDELSITHPRIGMTLLSNLGRELVSRMRRANISLVDRG